MKTNKNQSAFKGKSEVKDTPPLSVREARTRVSFTGVSSPCHDLTGPSAIMLTSVRLREQAEFPPSACGR